jgi:anti-sigma B factor antagonist
MTDTVDQPPLRWSVEHLDEATVVHVAGDVDLATQADFTDAVRSGLNSPAELIVLDLTGVDFLGSIGLRVMIQAQYDAKQAGQVLRVAEGSGGAVYRTLEVSGLDQVFELFKTVSEALPD